MRRSVDLCSRLSRDPHGMAAFSGLRPNSALPFDALLSGKGDVRVEEEEDGRGERERDSKRENQHERFSIN